MRLLKNLFQMFSFVAPGPSLVPVQIPVEKRILLRAAELIERNGWSQGQASDEKGRICAVEAIRLASIECGSMYDGYILARRAMSRTVTEHLEIPSWNDAKWRFKFQVLRGLRKAANSI